MKIKSLMPICVLLIMACDNRSSGQERENADSIRLKVAAYNVEFGRNATPQEFGEALKSHNFDIVGFSEAPGGDWTKEVADILGLDHVVVGRYTTAGHTDKYKSIASRTPLYDYEEILMTDTLHTVTRAKTVIGGKEIAVYSLHFPFGWRDQAHIDETTAKIASFANYLKERQRDEISLAMGDFNFIPSYGEHRSEYYEMFADIGLDFTWKDLGLDVTRLNTHNAFRAENEGSGRVIDHIMYNPAKLVALEGQILEMGNPLSDHKPVWALLQFK